KYYQDRGCRRRAMARSNMCFSCQGISRRGSRVLRADGSGQGTRLARNRQRVNDKTAQESAGNSSAKPVVDAGVVFHAAQNPRGGGRPLQEFVPNKRAAVG